MASNLESATVAYAGSVDDILSSTLLPIQLKYPERRFIFKIADGKAKVRMPREELEKMIDEIIANSDLFPRECSLIVQGGSVGESYLLSFVCTDPGLKTVPGEVLKNCRNKAIETKDNQQMALSESRRMVEFYGGQFQLHSEAGQGPGVTIALPQEEKTDSCPGRVPATKPRGTQAFGSRSFQADLGHDV